MKQFYVEVSDKGPGVPFDHKLWAIQAQHRKLFSHALSTRAVKLQNGKLTFREMLNEIGRRAVDTALCYCVTQCHRTAMLVQADSDWENPQPLLPHFLTDSGFTPRPCCWWSFQHPAFAVPLAIWDKRRAYVIKYYIQWMKTTENKFFQRLCIGGL